MRAVHNFFLKLFLEMSRFHFLERKSEHIKSFWQQGAQNGLQVIWLTKQKLSSKVGKKTIFLLLQ